MGLKVDPWGLGSGNASREPAIGKARAGTEIVIRLGWMVDAGPHRT